MRVNVAELTGKLRIRLNVIELNLEVCDVGNVCEVLAVKVFT